MSTSLLFCFSLFKVEELKALGYVPLLLWGKKKGGKSGGWLAEFFFPFHNLPEPAEKVLGKLHALYEAFCKIGWSTISICYIGPVLCPDGADFNVLTKLSLSSLLAQSIQFSR